MKKIRDVLVTIMVIISIHILLLCALDIKVPVWSVIIFFVSVLGTLIAHTSCVINKKREKRMSKND